MSNIFEKQENETESDYIASLTDSVKRALEGARRTSEENAMLKRVLKQLVLAAPAGVLLVDVSLADAAEKDERQLFMGGGQITLEDVG